MENLLSPHYSRSGCVSLDGYKIQENVLFSLLSQKQLAGNDKKLHLLEENKVEVSMAYILVHAPRL